MAEIEEEWARVTAWLAANVPAAHATLRPPAPTAELDACEQDLGVPLPVELRRLLLVSNGASDRYADGTYHANGRFLPGGHRPLSAAEVAQYSRNMVDVMAGLGFPTLMGSWWHPQWVMFASHIAGDGMVIDQRPGPGQGTVGEFINEGDAEFHRGTSLTEYIASMADSLENGTDFRRYRPLVGDDGRLHWKVVGFSSL